MKKLECIAPQQGRIDVIISQMTSDISRSYAQKLLKQQLVQVDGQPVKANYKCKAGQVISILLPDLPTGEVMAENIPLSIVYEDAHLLVVDKPQGMVVHPAAGNESGTLVSALLHHCQNALSQIGGSSRPGIVHRIDKDTSGLLLVAKDDATHIALAEQIKAHTLNRTYIALVHGNVRDDHRVIDRAIGRSIKDRKKMSVHATVSKHAVTYVSVLQRFSGYTFVECRLKTGRTHQIRVHMASVGHPVLGDKTYGIKQEKYKLNGQLLHAKKLGFVHPATGEEMLFETPIPERFLPFLKQPTTD